MGMTLNDFEAKALQVLLSQRFLSLPLFEEEELSEYHIADYVGEMNLEDFIRQYAEVITEQFEFDYETRLKADLVAMLTEIQLEIEEQMPMIDICDYAIDSCVSRHEVVGIIQDKIDKLKEQADGMEQQEKML